MSQITLYRARRILTMNPRQRSATHVAVRDGRILAVGDAACADGWGEPVRDERFADAVLTPGFVEAHSHLMAGGVWRFTYAGFHRRVAPDGGTWEGLTDIDAVLGRLREADARLGKDDVLVAWGFDPIFLRTERLARRHLDSVTDARPVVVLHSNFHMITVNSAALALARYDRGSNVEGIGKDADGEPSGEIRGMAAMFPILRRLGLDFRALARAESALPPFAETARRCGVTTASDLMNELTAEEVQRMRAVTGRADFPLRLYVAKSAHTAPPDDIAEEAAAIARLSTDKLRVGACKIIVDGSVQAFSAQLRWPGYYRVPDHSVWNMPPEKLAETVDVLNARGLQVHIHTNGDLATEMALQAIARVDRTPCSVRKDATGDVRTYLDAILVEGCGTPVIGDILALANTQLDALAGIGYLTDAFTADAQLTLVPGGIQSPRDAGTTLDLSSYAVQNVRTTISADHATAWLWFDATVGGKTFRVTEIVTKTKKKWRVAFGLWSRPKPMTDVVKGNLPALAELSEIDEAPADVATALATLLGGNLDEAALARKTFMAFGPGDATPSVASFAKTWKTTWSKKLHWNPSGLATKGSGLSLVATIHVRRHVG